MSRPSSNTNKLQLNNTSIPLQDARVAAGTHFPPTTADYPHDNDSYAGYPGDIYLLAGNDTVQTSNGWEYVFKNGGWCECWKTFSFSNLSLSGAVNGTYWKDVTPTESDRRYPVDFISPPMIEQGATAAANSSGNAYTFWLMSGGKVNSTTITEASLLTHLPPILIARPNNQTVSGKVFVFVRGRIG